MSVAGPRLRIAVPAVGSGLEGGVRHREVVSSVMLGQTEVLEQQGPGRLLTLGGDCAVEVASVAHLARLYGQRLFVLWLDAHADLNTPAGSPSGTAHGMPLRLLLDGDPSGSLPVRSCLSPTQVALAGARDLDPAEVDYCQERDLPLLTVASLEAEPACLAQVVPPGAQVYLHLDLDVLDPAALPAVAVPTPAGLTPAGLAQALAAVLAAHDVVGIGLTEYLPEVDHDPRGLDAVLGALGLASGHGDASTTSAGVSVERSSL